MDERWKRQRVDNVALEYTRGKEREIFQWRGEENVDEKKGYEREKSTLLEAISEEWWY